MKTIINIKADKDIKEHKQKVAEELSLPLNMSDQAEKDIEAGKNISGPFSSIDELIAHLDNL